MKKIAVLGATGSVGSQALEIARIFKNNIEIVCVSACKNVNKLAQEANYFKPNIISIGNEKCKNALQSLLKYKPIKIFAGNNALIESISILKDFGCDLIVLAVSGIAGLPLLYECLKHKLPVALANKESIVCGGNLIKSYIEQSGVEVLPVDSEHSAVFQCLGNSYNTTDVSRIWLTASGGPFLYSSKEEIDNALPAMALRHPNWSMGKKISIDSATMANKGLEVIEAHFLYGVAPKNIKVVIQPQSLIHSMVEMTDSSVLAQFAPVDMRLPLQKAMLYPKIVEFIVNKPLDFTKIGKIEFIEPDYNRFPCLGLAYDALHLGLTAVYCMADEVAVDLYLKNKIKFSDISRIINECMEHFSSFAKNSVAELMELNRLINEYVSCLLSD